jgi:hypothetical protein
VGAIPTVIDPVPRGTGLCSQEMLYSFYQDRDTGSINGQLQAMAWLAKVKVLNFLHIFRLFISSVIGNLMTRTDHICSCFRVSMVNLT